jgi:hypothetical protein
LYDVSFRMMHAGCPFAEISKKHEGSIIEWCNNKSDVFEVRSKDTENAQKVVNEFRRLARELGSVKMRVLSFGGEGSGVILQALSSCMCVRALKTFGSRRTRCLLNSFYLYWRCNGTENTGNGVGGYGSRLGNEDIVGLIRALDAIEGQHVFRLGMFILENPSFFSIS